MSSKALIKKSLFYLNCSGLNPMQQNLWSRIRASIMATILGVLLLEHVTDAIFHWEGLTSMQPIAATVTVQLGIHRLINLIINRKIFKELITCMEDFGTSTTIDKDFTGMLASYTYIGQKIIKSAVAFIFASSTFVFLIPVIFRIKWISLPLYHYSSESPYFEIINLLLFFSCNAIGICLLLPNEFLFASLLIHLVYELKILKGEIKMAALSIDEKTSLDYIRVFVERHNIVLRCVHKMSDTYSGLFFNQFLSTTVGLCASLVTVISGSLTDWTYLFAFLTISSIFLSQLFVYCLAGTLLMTECLEISVGAYNSKWWDNTDPNLRRALVIIIQRAQHETVLTAGGMIPLNIASFASVLKSVYTFYSVVISIYKG